MFDMLKEWADQERIKVIRLQIERQDIKANTSGAEWRGELEINALELEEAKRRYYEALKDLDDYYNQVKEYLKL